MNKPLVTYLKQADHLEFRYLPPTLDSDLARLAAIIGYMTGDGAIAKKSNKYTKMDGSVSIYAPKLQGAFYSNVKGDLVAIKGDLEAIGIKAGAVTIKKASAKHLQDGYQLQISHTACEELVKHGAPQGKKTGCTFNVPGWILGGTEEIKIAYLSALFGAEGTTPARDRNSKSRLPRQTALNMVKIDGTDGDAFFNQLKTMLASIGIESVVTTTTGEKYGKRYVTYWLRVSPKDQLDFFQRISFMYCDSKALLAWQWSQYMKAYNHAAKTRAERVIAEMSSGRKTDDIARDFGLTRGGLHALHNRVLAGHGTKPGHSFPHFAEWLAERWDGQRRLLRLKVVARQARPEKAMVWNIAVSSPDRSYLLANGANNYNCFETMTGRVYYPFDRKLHTGTRYKFNPHLPIWIGQDFNIDPMTSVIMQPQPNGEIWIVDEVVRFSSNTEDQAEELERKFWRHMTSKQITIYPDPAGAHRQHARGESDLDIMREKGFKRFKYRKQHPAIADRVNAVNRMLKAADGTVRLRINENCKHTIAALEQTIYKPNSREIDKSLNTEHAADALGYCIELEFPIRKIKSMGWSR